MTQLTFSGITEGSTKPTPHAGVLVMHDGIKIAIVGTRGIPSRYGGFETFAEHIGVRLAARGHAVTVYCDASMSAGTEYQGVKLVYSQYAKSVSPIRYYRETLRHAAQQDQVLIVTGVGGAFFYPFLRRRGCLLMTNIDGIEWKRGKWSWLGRQIIRAAECFAIAWSDMVIADSRCIQDIVVERYRAASGKIRTIEYGAEPSKENDATVLAAYGVRSGTYFLVVARLEPENNIELILQGFVRSGTRRRLLVVGPSLSSRHANRLRSISNDRVQFLGGIYDRHALSALRLGCYAYIHGHSVGGTNPSLLEAMASGNVCLCHDNPFNREVTQDEMFYFNTPAELASQIERVEKTPEMQLQQKRAFALQRILGYYTWDRIADEYERAALCLVNREVQTRT